MRHHPSRDLNGQQALERHTLVMRMATKCTLYLLLMGFCFCAVSYAAGIDESQVKASFVQFQQEWMNKLKQHGKYGLDCVQVSEDPDRKGTFIAKYEDLSEPSEPEIRKTGQKASPFVGVLHYNTVTQVSRGNTAEEAKRGPFKCESQEGVTEIFRFSKGKWIY